MVTERHKSLKIEHVDRFSIWQQGFAPLGVTVLIPHSTIGNWRVFSCKVIW